MGDPSIKNLVFKDRFGTSDDLLDDLLREKVNIYEALLEQKKMISKTKKFTPSTRKRHHKEGQEQNTKKYDFLAQNSF